MFIFDKNIKEKTITAGVVITCIIFIVWAIKILFTGGLALVILSLFFVLIPVSIFQGAELGYFVARFICGVYALDIASAPFNPLNEDGFMIWRRILHSGSSAECLIPLFKLILIVCVCMFLFFCLGEHARMRGIYPPRKDADKLPDQK